MIIFVCVCVGLVLGMVIADDIESRRWCTGSGTQSIPYANVERQITYQRAVKAGTYTVQEIHAMEQG